MDSVWVLSCLFFNFLSLNRDCSTWTSVWLFPQSWDWHRKSELPWKVHNHNASSAVDNVLLPNLCCPLPRGTAHLAFQNLGDQTQRSYLNLTLLMLNLVMLFILSPHHRLTPTPIVSFSRWQQWCVSDMVPSHPQPSCSFCGIELSLFRDIIVSRAPLCLRSCCSKLKTKAKHV